MILGIDIGNSNIVIGYIENCQIKGVSRISTDASMSVKDYCIKLKSIIDNDKTDPAELEGAVISSVVRPLTAVLSEAVHAITRLEPLIVSSKLKTGLSFSAESPEKLGCDRIADCVAAAAKYPLPIVVVDFGTATTISVVGCNSVFLGGMIAPGLKMSANALGCGTSQLPSVNLEAPKSCIGTNTSECIKSGIILGTASMVDGMVARIEKLLCASVSVVATGRLAQMVIPHCMRKIIHDDDLQLSGLAMIYEMNKK